MSVTTNPGTQATNPTLIAAVCIVLSLNWVTVLMLLIMRTCIRWEMLRRARMKEMVIFIIPTKAATHR